jgi:hypothetical protein
MGSDGWSGEESQFNKTGTFITVGPAVIGGLLLVIAPDLVPIPLLFGVIAVAGIIGGIMNIYERGPIAAGAVIGLVIALGGFGALYLWLNHRQENARKIELMIAFGVGAIPGFLLQFIIQKMLAARAEQAAPKKRPAGKPGAPRPGSAKPMRRV